LLDEIGDIPLELQPKLLRVLQEGEFERLGSCKTIRANVRLVVATHRDLLSMVRQGAFRSDLYYRLHVFPIIVPPLRERMEDVPCLVRHFVSLYAARMNKQVNVIPVKALEAFMTTTGRVTFASSRMSLSMQLSLRRMGFSEFL